MAEFRYFGRMSIFVDAGFATWHSWLMTKVRSEAKAAQTYVALRDNTERYWRDEITYAAFHAEQIRLWDAVDSATTERVLALLRNDFVTYIQMDAMTLAQEALIRREGRL